jgi:multisubunit Na+/H+ antiporter MnhB subunit
MRNRRLASLRIAVAAVAVVVTLVLAPAALAQSLSDENDATGEVTGQVALSGPGEADGSTLPLTGLDVALVLGGGAVLLAAGAALARLTAPTRR